MQKAILEKILFMLNKEEIEFRYKINVQGYDFHITDVLEVGSQMLCFAKINSKVRLFYKSRSNGSYRVAPFCRKGMFGKGIYVDEGGYTYETKLCLDLQKRLAKLENVRRYVEISELVPIISEYELLNMQEYQNREIQNVFSSEILYRYVPGRQFAEITDFDLLIKDINSNESINKFFSELMPIDYYTSMDVDDNEIESFVFSSNALYVTVNFFRDLKTINGERLFHIASIEGSDISDFGCSQVFYNIGFLSQKSMEYPNQLPELIACSTVDDAFYNRYVSTMSILNQLSIYESIQNLIITDSEHTLDRASKFQIRTFLNDASNTRVINFLEKYFSSMLLDLNVENFNMILQFDETKFVSKYVLQRFVFKALNNVLLNNKGYCSDFVDDLIVNSALFLKYKQYCLQRCVNLTLNADSKILREFIADGFLWSYFYNNTIELDLSEFEEILYVRDLI